MAILREEALELLRGGPEGVAEWNRYREGVDEFPSFSGADLTRANLRRTHLGGLDFTNATFANANLGEAGFTDTNLNGADMRDAVLIRTNFAGAELGGVTLNRAVCGETIFVNVDLTTADHLELVEHLGPSSIDSRTLALFKGGLPEGFLRGCGLQDWEIEIANLHRATTESRRTDIMYRVLELKRDQPISFYSVFISHSSNDKEFARVLESELQSRGIRCWLDERQILPGDDIYDAIDHGIRNWDKVILCCSRHALEQSWWVETEIKKVLGKEKKIRDEQGRKALALVPLDLDGYVFDHWKSGVKDSVLERNVADFSNYRKGQDLPDEPLDRLVRALQLDDHGREPVPEPKL